MKKNIIKSLLTLAAAATVCAGCEVEDYNENYLDGWEPAGSITDIRHLEYELTDADYKTIADNSANKSMASAAGLSGELKSVGTNMYFTSKVTGTEYIPNFLASAYLTLDDTSSIKVTYNTFSSAGFEEDFEAAAGKVPDTWANVVTNDNPDSQKWVGKTYSGNSYVQCSAFVKNPDKNYATEVYLVSPEITVEADMTFSFKACYGNYKSEGGKLSVLITTDLTGAVNKETIKAATWKDITDQVNITVPSAQYGTLEEVCSYKMDDFAGKEVRIAFRYDGDGTDGANKTTTVQIDDIKIADASGVVSKEVVKKTEQFVRGNKVWKFDPSIVWIIEYGKNKQPATDFFQACVDWVKANVENGSSYVSSFGNNDYYTGASAYQGNLDWRAASARAQYAAAFEGKTDEEVVQMMQDRTVEVFTAVLPQFYPDFSPLEGIEVTLTVQCGVYDGAATVYYNFVFKVVETGKFEFVSFAPVE